MEKARAWVRHAPFLCLGVLLRCDPGKVPLEKLAEMQSFLSRLVSEAERFGEGNRQKIGRMLDELAETVSGW